MNTVKQYIGKGMNVVLGVGIILTLMSIKHDLNKPIKPSPDPAPAVDVTTIQTWVVFKDKTRVTNPKIEELVKELAAAKGKYEAVAIPEPGKQAASLVITVRDAEEPPEPEPEPTPTPGPDLTGFPLEVWQQAKSFPPAECKSLANNYAGTASAIAAGAIKTMPDALETISGLNTKLGLPQERWKPFGSWLGSQFNKKAKTLDVTKQMMRDVAVGLEAVK